MSSAISGRRVLPLIPSQAYSNSPFSMSSGMTCFAAFIGTAKPMPVLAPVRLIICVLIPITLPCRSRSGPPELPGFMGASVWIT